MMLYVARLVSEDGIALAIREVSTVPEYLQALALSLHPSPAK